MTDTPEKICATITMEFPVSRIDDLLCCALMKYWISSGSTYWCDSIEVPEWPEGAEYEHQVLARGGKLYVRYDDGVDTVETHVGPDDLPSALSLMAKEHPHHFANFLAENEDANTGDVFFQLLCFGEVVYG